MKNNLCIAIVIMLTAAVACKPKPKEETAPTPPVTYDDYTALKPGNYWIYQRYMLDSANGEAHATGEYDSAYVANDTVIGTHTYHRYLRPTPWTTVPPSYKTHYLRDSGSYVVDEKGNILFSSEDFVNVFKSYTFGPNAATADTLYVTERMDYKNFTTVVPAGTFTTSAFRRIYRFPPSSPFGPTRSYNYIYAKNIGLVSETLTIYMNVPQLTEARLVRYHVN